MREPGFVAGMMLALTACLSVLVYVVNGILYDLHIEYYCPNAGKPQGCTDLNWVAPDPEYLETAFFRDVAGHCGLAVILGWIGSPWCGTGGPARLDRRGGARLGRRLDRGERRVPHLIAAEGAADQPVPVFGRLVEAPPPARRASAGGRCLSPGGRGAASRRRWRGGRARRPSRASPPRGRERSPWPCHPACVRVAGSAVCVSRWRETPGEKG